MDKLIGLGTHFYNLKSVCLEHSFEILLAIL